MWARRAKALSNPPQAKAAGARGVSGGAPLLFLWSCWEQMWGALPAPSLLWSDSETVLSSSPGAPRPRGLGGDSPLGQPVSWSTLGTVSFLARKQQH